MSIIPDDKDWTWVLERPCPECGYDASSLSTRDIAPVIERNAREWVTQLKRHDVATRARDDKWSVLEYACHVRDVERIFSTRLRLMLTIDNPTFENWDQDQTALAERYDLQNPTDVSVELELAARSLAESFSEVTDTQWARTGLRSNGSFFTVETLGKYFLHDIVHHLWDVTAE